ncbi:FAD-linked oxidase C-terminal domain-containing protein [Brevibacterium aurantiacum]|uniref:FAD-linked oxidase C-terminal domain-containing protein n=1 Tax=Brevibacterium aurantiacum TaxID=273384 RepID=UPI00186889C0|nr:FAD-linked oxidase C-terminal domain-containing protein [Brevibacterium aurantiacum]
MSRIESVLTRIEPHLPPGAIVTDENERKTYECDGLAVHRTVPALVIRVTSTAEVALTVGACHEFDVPFVARGSGTGLSGGAQPHAEGVLIVMSTMRDILDIDPLAQRAIVQPGVINLNLSNEANPGGYYFAPDPSSQSVCSIGGNVAENSGGAHCLKYGFTTNHVTGVTLVTARGDIVEIGGDAPEYPGYDLLGVLCGSEGTLGIVTEVTVRLTRLPEAVETLLIGFESTDAAGEAVSDIISAGIMPAAIEMMDALAIEAAEKAVACNYPEGAGAVLVVELDGPSIDVDLERETVIARAKDHGAGEIRVAVDNVERGLIWKGRKSAFAAVGRISPDYIVQDGVIPRSRLGPVLASISTIAEECGVRVANVFHAGDGNLHPLVLFDGSVEGQTELAETASGRILDLCLSEGGSITGEHGVGSDKAKFMPRMFTNDDLDTMQILRCAFDPNHLSNPGKVFPTPRLCGEPPRRTSGEHPLQAAGKAELF